LFLSFPGHFEFYSSQKVISNLKVLELDCAGTSSNSSISSVAVPSEVFIDSGNGWVISFMPRRTRLSEREVVMEDSESIPSTGVSNIVLEFSQLGVDGADVLISTRAHSVLLVIEPESVSIRSGSVVTLEDIVGMRNPETTRGLISIE
jgi:hypothetical protein